MAEHRIALRGWSLPEATAHRIATLGWSFASSPPTLNFKRLLDTSLAVDMLETSATRRLVDTTTAVTLEVS